MPKRNETHMGVIYQSGSSMGKEEKKGRETAIRTLAPSAAETDAAPTQKSKSRPNTVKFGKINQVIGTGAKVGERKVSYDLNDAPKDHDESSNYQSND